MFDYNALQKAAADDDDEKKKDDAPAAEPEEAAPTPEPVAATPAPAAVAAPTPATPGSTAPAAPSAVPIPSPPPGMIDAAGRGIERVRAAATRGRQAVTKGKQTVAKGQQAVDKGQKAVGKAKQLATDNQDTIEAARQSAQQRTAAPLAQHARDRLGLEATPGGSVLGGAPDPSIDSGPFALPADTDPAEASRLGSRDPRAMGMEEYQRRKQQRQADLKRRLAAPGAPPAPPAGQELSGTNRLIRDLSKGNEAERAAAHAAYWAGTSESPAAGHARSAIQSVMNNPGAREVGRKMRPYILGDQSGGQAAWDLASKAAPWLGGGYLAHRFALRPASRFLGGMWGAARNPAGSAAATAGANKAKFNQLVKQFRASGMSRAVAKQQASTVLASMQAQAMNTAQTAQSMAAKGQAYTGQPAAAKPAAGGGLSRLLQSASRRLSGLPGWGKALAGAGALGAGMYGGNKLLSSSYGGGSVKQANPLALAKLTPMLQRAKTGLSGWWKGLSPTAKTVGVGLAAAPTLSYMLGSGQQQQAPQQGMYDPTMQGTMTALPFQSPLSRMPSLFERQMQMARYASAAKPMTKNATVELEMADGSMHTFRA